MATNEFIGWDDAIENDEQEFVLLPEGEYPFKVVNFERGRFPGSAKIPACNKAVLTLQIDSSNGQAQIKTDLIMYRSMEWKISSFFRSIGQKKKGERLVPNWGQVVGSYGAAHVTQRKYVSNDGKEHTVNDIDRFIDEEEILPF